MFLFIFFLSLSLALLRERSLCQSVAANASRPLYLLGGRGSGSSITASAIWLGASFLALLPSPAIPSSPVQASSQGGGGPSSTRASSSSFQFH